MLRDRAEREARQEPQAIVARVLGEAGVYVGRWRELAVYPLFWGRGGGWHMVQSYEVMQLLEPERVDWLLMGELERWWSGAASRGLLEEPVPIRDAVALLKMDVKKGWEEELPVNGPAKRFKWRGGVWVDEEVRPGWATAAKGEPVKLPLG